MEKNKKELKDDIETKSEDIEESTIDVEEISYV